jgi:hypothetical protein
MVPSIALVTPSLDAAERIDRTIMSVVSQAGRFAIRYHVQDYGSSDGTIDRLRAWDKRLGTGDFPLQCDRIRFTWSSGPDEGLSAALLRGFGSLDLPDDPFMSWIHAGDVLMPGALAQVASVCQQFNAQDLAWLSGAVAVLQGDMLANIDEPALPSRAIRAGLCDGLHWPRVRPEGTFFRKWLWEAADPGSVFASFGLAGDWALWRAFAQRAMLVQARVPLAAAPSAPDQTAAYLAEINAHMPPDARHAELRALLEAGDIRRQVLCDSDMASGLRLQDAPVDMTAARRVLQRQGKHAPPISPDQGHSVAPPPRAADPVREDTDRRATPPMHDDTGPDWLVHGHAIMGMDSHWQFPAITEQHAFARLSALLADTPQEVLYVAFPWATLIDKLKTGAPDRHALMDRFEALCALLPSDRRKVTVCQHILARDYADLFRQAGIQDVFWAHTTRDDLSSDAAGGGPRFHPFPLYPVQTPEARPEDPPASDAAPREYLFSFIGAKANKFYLTQARSWILEHLATDPRGLIRGRDGWHYQRVVYDLQVRKTAQDDGNGSFVDSAASEEFRAALCNSTFALCPSGTGPNSIRLWEALEAGAIPVILADSWAPPGDRRLWDLAAIFCKETPEDIRALPERLAAIAADPERLASMRHAMRQLWLLYGAPFFVSDLLEFMLAHASRSEQSGAGTPDSAPSARQLLISWSGRLLLEPEAALDALGVASGPAAALTAARRRCTDPAVQAHFDAALSRALKRGGRALPQLAPADPAGTTPDTAVATPAFVRGAPLRVCLFGKHANRTPLAYDAFRRHLDDHFIWTPDPAEADLVVTGFDRDFREAARQLHALVTPTTGPRLAVISEEPLWDITWSGAPEGGTHGFSQGDIRLDYAYLAHGSSEIFQTGTLPYYVLTENRFITRFASLMSRQAQRTPEEMLAHWRRAPLPAAFFAEKRTGVNYRMDTPSGQIVKLSTYRTELAERMQQRGALCMGKGWGGNTPRQALPDWHLDKLAWLHERCALMGALENMHHELYVSEKIFDAFACGAVPVYFAGQDHRVFDLVPEAAIINTYGLDVAAAVARMEAFSPDAALARSWLDTAVRLAKLFGDPALVERERKRIADAVMTELRRLA